MPFPRFLTSNRRALAGVLALISSGELTRSSHAATPEQIDAAIQKGVDFLYKRQNELGHWDRAPTGAPDQNGAPSSPDAGQYGGVTALATYALLASGERPTDPRVAKPVAFLRGTTMVGYYAIGLRAQVWLNLPPSKENKAAMARDARLLLDGQSKLPSNLGLYTYVPAALFPAGAGVDDLSCSQYGVLGAWAAAQVTKDFPKTYWQTVETAWRLRQKDDGGWTYEPSRTTEAATLTMTAAGLATLYITQEYVHADAGIAGSGNIADPAIDKGMNFVAKNFPTLLEPTALRRGYALYGIERVGVASGLKYFNGIDWYARGADFLVNAQQPDGSWSYSEGPVADTSFILLFLARGRAPVMMNKLQYSTTDAGGRTKEGYWNQRPRDVANATHWVGRETERTLNWQIVNLDVATVADLHDSPVLYIAGGQKLALPAGGKAKIKQFIDEGGMVLSNADVGREPFAESVEALALEMFPAYRFEDVPANHPLYVGQSFLASKWTRQPKVRMMTNGSRVLFLLVSKDDFGKAWQRNDDKKSVEEFQFIANVFLYSVDKQNARVKGFTHVVTSNPAIVPNKVLKVARLKYKGNWDPEPGGWRRMAAVLHNRDRIALDVQTVEMKPGALAGFHVAHLTGTDAFQLGNEEREVLRAFARAGGVLLVDAAGGSPEFTASADKELKLLYATYPGGYGREIPASSLLFKTNGNGKLDPKYRNYALLHLTGDPGRFHLKGIESGALPVVVFSPEDFSTGIVGMAVDGVVGYTPEVATELVRNCLLKVAATKPFLPQPVVIPAATKPTPPVTPPADGKPKPPPGPVWNDKLTSAP